MLTKLKFHTGLLLIALAVMQSWSLGHAVAQVASVKQPELASSTKQIVLTLVNMFIKTAYAPGADFTQWPQVLAKQQAEIDKAETAKDFTAALNSAFGSFHVSHLVLYSPQAAQSRAENKTVGIGVILQIMPDGLLITNVLSDAPAEKAGLVIGDKIVEVDNKKPENQLVLVGPEGSKVTLKLRKPDGKVRTVSLTRAKFSSVRPPTLIWISKDSAVLKIPTFDVAYDAKRVETLMKEAAGAKNLIVDFRSNPGGSVVSLLQLLGYFMKEGTPIGTFVTREVSDGYAKATGQKPLDMVKIAHWSDAKVKASGSTLPVFSRRVAVLVNGGTGSAAEIAAAALQEVVGAPVVGSRSAGAVLQSVLRTLMVTGYMFQYPISDYITLNGVRLEGNGVTVNADVPAPQPGQKDAAVDIALALLRRTELRNERFGR